MVDYDHPLNHIGIKQALDFNARMMATAAGAEGADMGVLEQEFLRAEKVFASPLSRALQTALLTCANHPSMARNGIQLLRYLRERKNTPLSLDTVGIEIGDGIMRRVCEQLTIEAADPPMSADDVRGYVVPVDVNDCTSQWWTPKSSRDTGHDIASRLDTLMRTLKYDAAASAILVGHSLFFRELVKAYLSEEFKQRCPEFSEKLCQHKLANAACLHIKCQFHQATADDSKPVVEIMDASLLFGSTLKDLDPEEVAHEEKSHAE